MTTTIHKNLTGSDLHEPKGAASALSGQVYVADGAGSGAWTPASSVVTNTAFTTGDLKITHKTTADATWIMWGNGTGVLTIGDGSSGGLIRANADTAALFALYWNNYTNTQCPVSSGRGVSAAADFAAHKTISLPAGMGRALGVAGNPTDLTTNRLLGSIVGEETHVLANTELPAHSHAVTDPGHFHLSNLGNTAQTGAVAQTVGALILQATSQTMAAAVTNISINNSTGGGGAHNNMQPTTFVNVMIKL